jgi:hypothetical protein
MICFRKALLPTTPRSLDAPAGTCDQNFIRRQIMTGMIQTMWVVWGVIGLLFLATKMYIGRLSKYEENQLILDDAFSQLKTEQDAIQASIHKFAPIQLASQWLFIAATLFVVGYYALDVINQFN